MKAAVKVEVEVELQQYGAWAAGGDSCLSTAYTIHDPLREENHDLWGLTTATMKELLDVPKMIYDRAVMWKVLTKGISKLDSDRGNLEYKKILSN